MLTDALSDKSAYYVNIFSYFPTKTCYGYSLEVLRQGTSSEYRQHMFSWRNKKNIDTFGLKKASYQKGCECITKTRLFKYESRAKSSVTNRLP